MPDEHLYTYRMFFLSGQEALYLIQQIFYTLVSVWVSASCYSNYGRFAVFFNIINKQAGKTVLFKLIAKIMWFSFRLESLYSLNLHLPVIAAYIRILFSLFFCLFSRHSGLHFTHGGLCLRDAACTTWEEMCWAKVWNHLNARWRYHPRQLMTEQLSALFCPGDTHLVI